MARWPLRWLSLLLLGLACRSSDPETDINACHWDCFGRVDCRDGQVTVWLSTPVPCSEWTGQCPRSVVGQCQKGCGADTLGFPEAEQCPLNICRENFPKRAGDSCGSDVDCLPTPATERTDSFEVANTYLRCDLATHRCVERPPVTVPDWLRPCSPAVIASISAEDRAHGTFDGALMDPSCSGGICIFESHAGEACVRQGCSRSCLRDDECPQGASCTREPSMCPVSGSSPADPGYCKLGSRLSIGNGLECPK